MTHRRINSAGLVFYTNDRDVPNRLSKSFEIKNWETKDTVVGYDTYTVNNDDINELKEICKIQI